MRNGARTGRAQPSDVSAMPWRFMQSKTQRCVGGNILAIRCRFAPSHLRFDGDWYRRRAKTPNRCVATLFGTITLWRYLYQPIHGVERSIFPLEIRLGLAAGRATPALAGRVAHAAVDSTQDVVRSELKRDRGVAWSVATLRAVIAETWEGMAPHAP